MRQLICSSMRGASHGSVFFEGEGHLPISRGSTAIACNLRRVSRTSNRPDVVASSSLHKATVHLLLAPNQFALGCTRSTPFLVLGSDANIRTPREGDR